MVYISSNGQCQDVYIIATNDFLMRAQILGLIMAIILKCQCTFEKTSPDVTP